MTRRKQLCVLIGLAMVLASLVFPRQPQAAVQSISPTNAGVSVGSAAEIYNPGEQVNPMSNVVTDGAGGFYVAWIDERDGLTGTPYSIYVQRFGSDGTTLWPDGGVQVASVLDAPFQLTQSAISISPDGTGGVYVVWRDDPDNDYFIDNDGRIFSQHLDSSGNLLYPAAVTDDQAYVSSISTFTDSSPAQTVTFSHSATGNDRFLVIAVATDRGPSDFAEVSSVTWDGLATTEICHIRNDAFLDNSEITISTYYFNNPEVKTGDIEVTFSDPSTPNEVVVLAQTLSGVNTTNPVNASTCFDSDAAGHVVDGSLDVQDIYGELTAQGTVEARTLWGVGATGLDGSNELSVVGSVDDNDDYVEGNTILTYQLKPADTGSSDNEFHWDGTVLNPWTSSGLLLNLASMNDDPSTAGVELNTDLYNDYFVWNTYDIFDGQNIFVLHSPIVDNDDSDMYAFRLDATGTNYWSTSVDGSSERINQNPGVRADTTSAVFDFYDNHFFTAWYDSELPYDSHLSSVLVQRVNLDRNLLWNAGGDPAGVNIDSTPGAHRGPIGIQATDEGGAIVVFWRRFAGSTPNDWEIVASRVDYDGNPVWETVIHEYSEPTLWDHNGKMIESDDGNYIVAFSRGDQKVIAQKFDEDGNILWDEAGIQVGSELALNLTDLDIVEDGDGGVFIAVADADSGQNLLQGLRSEDGSLLWADFFDVSENGIGIGVPGLISFGDGQTAVVWGEDREGTQSIYAAVITNYYQIKNLDNLTPEDADGDDISFGSNNGVRNSSEPVTIIDGDNDYPLTSITTNLTYDRDWNEVSGDVDDVNHKSFVSQLTTAEGAASSHTLYVPYDSSHQGVIICPNATSLGEVSENCDGAIVKVETDADTSITTVNGKQVWAVTGLTGTGGIGDLPDEESGEEPSGGTAGFSLPATLEMLSPKDYTSQSQPTLSFKKAQLGEGSVSSYEVSLDPGRNYSFLLSGLPANNSNQPESVWRDDSQVKVTYHNEQDSDSTNDEIHVYFKGLNAQSLAEGEHNWRVKVHNNLSQSQEYNQGFKVDLYAPDLTSWSISGQQSPSSADTYFLTSGHRPAISGQASDPYRGGLVTNSNGTQDTFTKVAAGPSKVLLKIEKLTFGVLGTPFAVYADFDQSETSTGVQTDLAEQSKSAPYNLEATKILSTGGYKVQLLTRDAVGNTASRQIFYLNVGGAAGLVIPSLPSIDELPFGPETGSEIIETSLKPSPTPGGGTASNQVDLVITVVDKNGDPLVGARVQLSNGQTTTTDEAGRAIFSDIPSGNYQAEISHELGSTTQKIEILEGMESQSFTIRLGDTSQLPLSWLPLLPEIGNDILGIAIPYASVMAGVILPVAGFVVLLSTYGSAVSPNLAWKLLQALGLFAKNQPQGLVFETEKHAPVPFALLTVRSKAGDASQHSLLETIVSDVNGVYQGISLPPGMYAIEAAHQQYRFPAQPSRIPYLTMREFYRGEPFKVMTAKLRQFFLVPLDPIARNKVVTWSKLGSAVRTLLSKLNLINFGLPMALLSVLIAVLHPSIINWLIVVVYGVFLVRALPSVIKLPIIVGKVKDASGRPLSNVVVRLSSLDGNSYTAIVTSDHKGEFKIYGAKAKYQINLFKPGYEWQHDGSPMSFEEIDTRYQTKKLEIKMGQAAAIDMSPLSIKPV